MCIHRISTVGYLVVNVNGACNRYMKHTGHTRDTQEHKGTRITPKNLTTIQIHQYTQDPYVSATAETAADSTAAGPEPTAPRGRLRRGRPQRTRPCLHPLPERLPAPAQRPPVPGHLDALDLPTSGIDDNPLRPPLYPGVPMRGAPIPVPRVRCR